MEWRSVRALSHEEASTVLKGKILAKRVLRTHSCFRDKAKGLGPLRAKCRVVALGHCDPNLCRLNRECPTPNRTSEHVLFLVLTAGSNREFSNTKKKWFGWTGDAATAFLQGEQPANERTLPLYIKPPDDGVTRSTGCWKAPLCLVLTNIYGLANAPRLWANTVVQRLKKLGYRQHSFDRLSIRRRLSRRPPGGLFHRASVAVLQVGVPKQGQARQGVYLQSKTNFPAAASWSFLPPWCQAEFIDGLSVGKIPRGADLDATLSPEQRAEFRSDSGNLWMPAVAFDSDKA